jgi:hypothetical protein
VGGRRIDQNRARQIVQEDCSGDSTKSQEAAARQGRQLAVSVSTRQCQEPDFRCTSPAGQGQLSAKSANWRCRPRAVVVERPVSGRSPFLVHGRMCVSASTRRAIGWPTRRLFRAVPGKPALGQIRSLEWNQYELLGWVDHGVFRIRRFGASGFSLRPSKWCATVAEINLGQVESAHVGRDASSAGEAA